MGHGLMGHGLELSNLAAVVTARLLLTEAPVTLS